MIKEYNEMYSFDELSSEEKTKLIEMLKNKGLGEDFLDKIKKSSKSKEQKALIKDSHEIKKLKCKVIK